MQGYVHNCLEFLCYWKEGDVSEMGIKVRSERVGVSLRGGVISILEILLVDGMSYGVLGLCWSIMVIHSTRTTTLCTSQNCFSHR